MMEELYGREYAEAQSRNLPIKYKQIITDWLHPSAGDTILEIGSGGGDIVKFLKQSSPNSFGSDLNYNALVRLNEDGLTTMDATGMAIATSSVDKSVSLHALEHIPDLHRVFTELDRITKPGGLSYHAFPSFYITKAEGAYFEAWNMTHNPFKAWKLANKLHVHNLSPDKIKGFADGTSWKMTKSEKIFIPEEGGFAWNVLLKKPVN